MEERFVRFVVPASHRLSGHAAGIFHVLGSVRRRDLRRPVRFRYLRDVRWFCRHLTVPEIDDPAHDVLFWFRRNGGESLRRAHVLARMLRGFDVPVETVQTTDPGEIVYRDEDQVAARPRPGTYTGTVVRPSVRWVEMRGPVRAGGRRDPVRRPTVP